MDSASNRLQLKATDDISSAKIPRCRGNAWEIPSRSENYHTSSDVSLFSSSLPVLRHEKLDYMEMNYRNKDDGSSSSGITDLVKDMKGKVVLDDLNVHGIGSLLPDDEDDLLAGIEDDFDLSGLPSQLEDLEGDGVFPLDLDYDTMENLSVSLPRTTISEGYVANGTTQYSLPNGVGTVAGEHPYGEHPSRTLFVRNINSNVEDSELRSLFQQYGDIRTLYTACKHRGFVMISYYDIRDARAAMRALQNKPLRRRKLDIHFSIPKDNPSDKDMNQGTLVAFNLDPSVSNDDLRQIFGAYGEVKEIRETPHKRHHKFIEFYDVRAAEAALRALNRSDIAGKRIKLEPSRPGGARRNLMQQLSHELEQDETRNFRHHMGSPIANSPPGTWAKFGSPGDNSPLQSLSRSPTLAAVTSVGGNNLPGLASILPSLPNSIRIPPIGKDSRAVYPDRVYNSAHITRGIATHQSHSLPEDGSGILSNMASSPGLGSSFGHTVSGASNVGTLSGPQFLWGSSNPSSAWPMSSLSQSFGSNGQTRGFPYSNRDTSLFVSSQPYHGHHVGSAPSGIPFERHFGFSDSSALAGAGFSRNDASLISMNARGSLNPGAVVPGHISDNSSLGFRMMASQQLSHMIHGGSPYSGLGSAGMESLIERGRNRRLENNANQLDSKKQYQLDLDKIIKGEDTRTTLMIKNIPNKYTSKMLLAAIDENHKGTYDFLYLPIDFKNKCNVGYAFINMVSASHIISFYQAFNGKKWEKFNSEKVASLAYARIQGKAALVAHFQNSSLMNEDKRCRPILFNSKGPDACDQEPFPLMSNITIQVPQLDEIVLGDSPESPENANEDLIKKPSPMGSNSIGR